MSTIYNKVDRFFSNESAGATSHVADKANKYLNKFECTKWEDPSQAHPFGVELEYGISRANKNKARATLVLGGTLAAVADAVRNAAGLVWNLVKAGVYACGASYTFTCGVIQEAFNVPLYAATGRRVIKVITLDDLNRRKDGFVHALKNAALCGGKAIGYTLFVAPTTLIAGLCSPNQTLNALEGNNIWSRPSTSKYVSPISSAEGIQDELEAHQAMVNGEAKEARRIKHHYTNEDKRAFKRHDTELVNNVLTSLNIPNRKKALKSLHDLANGHTYSLGVRVKNLFSKFNVFGRRPDANAHAPQEQGRKGSVDAEPMSNVTLSDFLYAAFKRKPVRSPDVTINVGERPNVKPSLKQRMGNAFNTVTKKVRFSSGSVAPSAVELGRAAPATVAPATAAVSLSNSVSSASSQGATVAVSVSSSSYVSSSSPAASSAMPAPAVASSAMLAPDVASTPAVAAHVEAQPQLAKTEAPAQPSLFGRIRNSARWPSGYFASKPRPVKDGYGDYGMAF